MTTENYSIVWRCKTEFIDVRWHSWNWNWRDWRSNWRRSQRSRRAPHQAPRFRNEIRASGVVCPCYCSVFCHRLFPEPAGLRQIRPVSVNWSSRMIKIRRAKRTLFQSLLSKILELLWKFNLPFLSVELIKIQQSDRFQRWQKSDKRPRVFIQYKEDKRVLIGHLHTFCIVSCKTI